MAPNVRRTLVCRGDLKGPISHHDKLKFVGHMKRAPELFGRAQQISSQIGLTSS